MIHTGMFSHPTIMHVQSATVYMHGEGLFIPGADLASTGSDPDTRSLVTALLSARPDTVLVEVGLPLWQPPGGACYLVTHGASRASAQAAAELLGLSRRPSWEAAGAATG